MIRWTEAQRLRSADVRSLYVENDLDLLVLRGQLSESYRRAVTERFWSAPPTRRDPPAAGHEVGTHHFDVALDEYLAAAARSAPEVARVLGPGGRDEVGRFRRRIEQALAELGIRLRVAEHGSRPAAAAIVRSWESELVDSGYELGPHDDTAQLAHRGQAGFEIQSVPPSRLVATNLCIDVRSGGDLVLWDHRGSDADRASLGIAHDAYPYPADFLAGIESIRVPLGAGDVALLRGELVHAITRSPGRVVGLVFLGGPLT